jgi:hypothetical protein
MSATTHVTLDRIMIAALAQCDRVLFRHYEGQSTIEAIKNVKPSPKDPFAPEERRVVINCDSGWNDWTPGTSWRKPESFIGFACVHAPKYRDSWVTIVSLLKAGDTLRLCWERSAWHEMEQDSDSGKYVIKPGGFHEDRVSLQVSRKGKRMSFDLEHSVAPMDSYARLVREVVYKATESATETA